MVDDLLSGLLSHLRWQDLLDLLLVWVMVYRVLLLTKKTGSAQILSGIGFLAFAYLGSIWLELVTFNYILDKIFSNLFLVVVILFQGEIRRALALIGSNPFFSSSQQANEDQIIEELIRGLSSLTDRGYGALVVIEREMALEYFVEPGVPLHASLSAELLQSLFHPASPLHDGAALVKRGQLDSAGCFLPLSKSGDIDKTLGTRHRAAMGLTEETDAVVLVVSEESRSVGLAQGGQLEFELDPVRLRTRLFEVFGRTQKRGGEEWSAD